MMTKSRAKKAAALRAKEDNQPQKKERPSVSLAPLNQVQAEYIDSLQNWPCVIVEGSAGTGKTYLASTYAAQQLSLRNIGRIILSRANVSTGKSLGAFPGSVEEKMAPWLMPITDVLKEHLGGSFFDLAVKRGIIQYQPIETIRGRSFPNAIILIDEAQQLTKDELKAIVTRVGEDSLIVLMGDVTQRDTYSEGLEWLARLAEQHDLPVACHKFDSDDIVRSELCKQFVQAFEAEEN